ncbi:MAG: hypothetical protein AB1656_24135 [Candidatus Omnitrophota bacterium]
MPIDNCSRCGELFNKIKYNICNKCLEEEESLLRDAKDYLLEHPNAMIIELVEELEIEEWMFEKWIREKRIQILSPEEMMKKRHCVQCGRELKDDNAMYCKNCMFKQTLQKKVEEKEEAPKVKEEPLSYDRRGMHYKKFKPSH